MNNRESILDGLVAALQNISVANSYSNTVMTVGRTMKSLDQVKEFPELVIVGGRETFDTEMGLSRASVLTVHVRGYTRSKEDPQGAQTSLIADVIKCLESSLHNPTYWSNVIIRELETDEGWLHLESPGAGLFDLVLDVHYDFSTSSP